MFYKAPYTIQKFFYNFCFLQKFFLQNLRKPKNVNRLYFKSLKSKKVKLESEYFATNLVMNNREINLHNFYIKFATFLQNILA